LSQVEEGVLDPWVVQWLEENAAMMEPPAEYSQEYLDLTRPSVSPFPTRPMARTSDEILGDVPVRIYEEGQEATGLVVYFHGGGFCSGSIALMEIIATELAHCGGAVVISVGYRLAPEHPYPAGLEDCEAVTRWALANAERFGVPKTRVVVAGESAGGNLAAAVTLRLRGEVSDELAGQLLIYPVVDGPSAGHPSRRQFETAMLRAEGMDRVWKMYSGDRHIDDDPFAVPLQAESLAGLPPALVVLGGCDFLRDEGRLYAERLKEEGVPAEELCLPGQPHGFLNLGFPAAEKTYASVGRWLRNVFASRSQRVES